MTRDIEGNSNAYLFAAMDTGKDLCCGPRRTGGFSRNGLF